MTHNLQGYVMKCKLNSLMTELIFTSLPLDDQGPASVSASVKNYFLKSLEQPNFKQECSVGAPFFLSAYILCWCNQNGNPTCLNMINIGLYGEKKVLGTLTFMFIKKYKSKLASLFLFQSFPE